jgi:type I restriction enzyme S subunit
VTTTARTITNKGLESSSAKMVPTGAVLVAMYGSIGKLGIAGISLATNQAIAFAIPNESLITQKYLFYFLWSQREKLLWSGKGATQQNISQTILKAWKIPLPPLPEQHKIVEILEDHLSRLDASIALADAMEKQSAGLRRSLLQAAFTGQLTKEVASV